jgi:hypothetical protein
MSASASLFPVPSTGLPRLRQKARKMSRSLSSAPIYAPFLIAVAGLLLVPFTRLGIQGGKTTSPLNKESDKLLEQGRYDKSGDHALGSQTGVPSLDSAAKRDSRESQLPRWSW